MVFRMRVPSFLETLRRGSLSFRSPEPEEDHLRSSINSASTANTVMSAPGAMPRHGKCSTCGSLLLFPPATEQRTCAACGCVTYLSEVRDMLPTPPNDEDVFDVEDSIGPTPGEAIYKRQGSTLKRQHSRKGQDEYAENTDCLVLLMRLALTVCNADILDCVAVMRTLNSKDRSALHSVASRVLKELSRRRGRADSGGVGSEREGSTSKTMAPMVAEKTVENIVLSFLQEVLENDKGLTTLSRRPSLELMNSRSFGEESIYEEPSIPARLKHAATSRTEISVSSFSEFVKEHKSFSLRSDSNLNNVMPTDAQAISEHVSAHTEAVEKEKKPTRFKFKKNTCCMTGSLAEESVASKSTKVSKFTEASTMIRSLLRKRGDQSLSKPEQIGDMTWGLDGVPQYEGGDHDVQQTQALLQRYGESCRAERSPPVAAAGIGSAVSAVDTAEDFVLNKGSLLMHVKYSARMVVGIGGMPEEVHPEGLSVCERRSSKESTAQETEATWMLLDKATKPEDVGGASAYLKQMRTQDSGERQALSKEPSLSPPVPNRAKRRTMSNESGLSNASSVIRDAIAIVEAHSTMDLLEQLLPGMAGEKEEDAPTTAGVTTSMVPTPQTSEPHVPSSDPTDLLFDSVVQPTAEEEAMAKWQERRKKKRALNAKKTTYGQVIRNEHKQMLPLSGCT